MFVKIVSEIWIGVNVVTIFALGIAAFRLLSFYSGFSQFNGESFLYSWVTLVCGMLVYGINKFLANPPYNDGIYRNKILFLNNVANKLILFISFTVFIGMMLNDFFLA